MACIAHFLLINLQSDCYENLSQPFFKIINYLQLLMFFLFVLKSNLRFKLKFKKQDMQDLEKLLFHDKFEKRQKWFEIFNDPIWTPQFNVPLTRLREKAYINLKKVAHSGIVSVKNFFDDPTNIFTAHENIGMVDGSTATKFTVHYNLFGGSIVALHTDRHKHIFDKIDSLQITGCFCLTELGYGNNAVMMETTAIYDQQKKCFIINCPTVQSQKYWITSGAVHANQALVFAQTIVKGKNQGINAFLVPIRDSNLISLPNVEIHDMGFKIGLNGIDNAALKFHNVRIPRENLMNKYCDIGQNGQFKHDIKGIQQRFFKVTERLLSGRLCIASMTIGALKTLIYITMKYSCQRRGVSPNGKSQTAIFDYQLQQNTLVPIIARTLGINMLHNYAKYVFANQKNHLHDLLMICCVDKTLVGWHTERSISTMRERCGGQGFLAANMFGEGLSAAHAAVTAEGDNKVLMIKVVKDLLSLYLKSPEYFYSGEQICLNNQEDLLCLKKLSQLFELREKRKLQQLIQKMSLLKAKGLSNFDILMLNTSDQIQQLAICYGQKIALKQCLQKVELLKESKEIVRDFFVIFAHDILNRELGSFILNKWITVQLAHQLKEVYNNLIKKAAKSAQKVVMSFNIPSHAIKAPIANNYVLYNSYGNHGQLVNAKL